MTYFNKLNKQTLKFAMLFVFATSMIPNFLSAQTEGQSLYEVVRIKVKKGQEKAFEAAVKAHNDEFHGDGMHRARLAFNINGPYGNMYSWIMGPTNYAAMDSRPSGDSHDEDWSAVSEFIEEFQPPTYWSLDPKLSHSVDNDSADKDLIWVYDIKNGEYDRWAELVERVKEVYVKKLPTESFRVCWNEFSDTNKGHDVAVLFGLQTWGELDLDRDFGKLYEEVHGPKTWNNFLNDFRATVNARVDWLRMDVK